MQAGGGGEEKEMMRVVRGGKMEGMQGLGKRWRSKEARRGGRVNSGWKEVG